MQMRLFEPFYTTERSGTGLGLFIARELAEANDGLLRSLPQNVGALFRLTCPLAPCMAKDAQ
jgi:two-component system sensor histidine kinase PilS (NtrC family)